MHFSIFLKLFKQGEIVNMNIKICFLDVNVQYFVGPPLALMIAATLCDIDLYKFCNNCGCKPYQIS